MPCTDKSRNRKMRENLMKCVLAFFSVVASYSNLSTFQFGCKDTHIPWNNDEAKAYLTYQRNRPLLPGQQAGAQHTVICLPSPVQPVLLFYIASTGVLVYKDCSTDGKDWQRCVALQKRLTTLSLIRSTG